MILEIRSPLQEQPCPKPFWPQGTVLSYNSCPGPVLLSRVIIRTDLALQKGTKCLSNVLVRRARYSQRHIPFISFVSLRTTSSNPSTPTKLKWRHLVVTISARYLCSLPTIISQRSQQRGLVGHSTRQKSTLAWPVAFLGQMSNDVVQQRSSDRNYFHFSPQCVLFSQNSDVREILLARCIYSSRPYRALES